MRSFGKIWSGTAFLCVTAWLGWGGAAMAAVASPGQLTSCEALRGEARADLVIAEATSLPASAPAPAGNPLSQPTPALPAHCRVRGMIGPRKGAGGHDFGIGFELRMPAQWNGRFLFQGGGGLDGSVQSAVGAAGDGPPALARGFAVVSMDGGHKGADASFALDQQARLDFAYAAIGKVTAVAKALVAEFYGSGPKYTYFAGCSNGGREAMIAMDRYPLEFDGIVAGDPGFHLSRAAVAEAWNTRQFASVAPKDEQGRAILGRAFSPDDLKLVATGILADCDQQDGLADGMINNVQACRFDPGKLRCQGAKTAACLSAGQVTALRKIFGGPHDSVGHAIYAGLPYDAGVGASGWRVWMTGFSSTAQSNGINQTLGHDALTKYFQTPPQSPPQSGAADFDFDRDVAKTEQVGAINDATSTFLNSFSGHGGKLIIYQGMSDPVFSATDIIAWYGQLAADAGPPQSFARLYLVPGMNHCMGGPATDRFDLLSSIVAWVEDGKPADRIVATGSAFPRVSRPLCPYPLYARYRGPEARDEKSFECVAPQSNRSSR